ncbi:MAG: hypothetical protein KBD73_01940 [Candidatus Magasanikbacteria bacterium]|nr:hypothetical protein [Candidatus Magasanikbacteria bacterium]
MLLHIWPILGLGIRPYSLRFVIPHLTVIIFSASVIWLSRLIKNSTDK